MTTADYYFELLECGRKCLESLSADEGTLTSFTQAHNFQTDFGQLYEAIKGRPEGHVFLLAQREYQFALYALSIANYRHAFISLRLFFELSLATIEFSAHEISFRRWVANLDDISWSKITSSEVGIYSDSFLRAFDADLAPMGRQYGTMAIKVYRECSEYVHGNLRTHESPDSPLEFRKDYIIDWCEKADTVRRCVIFAFAGRFLKLLDAGLRNSLEVVMLDVLGDVPAVQVHYEKNT